VLFFHGERVDELVARVERRVDGPAAAERVLEVVDEALEEVERTGEDREEALFGQINCQIRGFGATSRTRVVT
jgi:hypothetical protein